MGRLFLTSSVLLLLVAKISVNGQLSFDSDSVFSQSGDELLIALESKNSNTNPRAFDNFGNSNRELQYHKWFSQKLDHLKEDDTRVWEQRFIESGVYHKPGGPVFMHIDGEGTGLSSPVDLIKRGSMAQYAKDQGAYFVALEHRFYGLSHPTADLSRDNLKYLNIRQAIGDIFEFITWFKTHRDFQNNKWVLFGSSYGGSLAKWFSQTYPNVTDVLVASSAPLELKYEMTDYLQHIGELIKQTDNECYDDLTEGFNCLENAIHGRSCGEDSYSAADLKPLFNLCGNLRPEEEQDVTGLFYTIFNTFNNVIVNNIPDPRLNVSLQGVCSNLKKSRGTESALTRLARVLQEITRASEVNCIEFRLEKVIKYIQSTSWKELGSVNGDRQFQWQRCNELGWIKGSNTPMLPFGPRISTSFHAKICKRVFRISAETTKKNIQQSNLHLKGKTIPGQCGIYVNGNNDPWSRLGVTSEDQVGACNRAVLIRGASHAKDKGNILPDISTTLSFPPDLRAAQREIGKILDNWIKTGNCCSPKLSGAGGRVLSDRYFYPIPTPTTRQQNPPTQKSQNPVRRLEFPSDLLPNNSTVPSIQIPSNEISVDETRRVETRTVEESNKIAKNTEFKELTDFIKRHEQELFSFNSSKKSISDGNGKRYRVKIRSKHRRFPPSTNFSRFGFKIKPTVLSNPVENPHDPVILRDTPEHIAKAINSTDLKPWWLWKDTFEPRKLHRPNPKLVRVGSSSSEDAVSRRSGSREKPRKSSRPKIISEVPNPVPAEESLSLNISNTRGERKLIILNLNDKQGDLYLSPDSREIESTSSAKKQDIGSDNRGNIYNVRKRVSKRVKTSSGKSHKNTKDDVNSNRTLTHDKASGRRQSKNEVVSIPKNNSKRNETLQRSSREHQKPIFSEQLPFTKIVFTRKRIQPNSRQISFNPSEIDTDRSHEAPLFLSSRGKSSRKRVEEIHVDVIEDNPIEIGISKLNSDHSHRLRAKSVKTIAEGPSKAEDKSDEDDTGSSETRAKDGKSAEGEGPNGADERTKTKTKSDQVSLQSGEVTNKNAMITTTEKPDKNVMSSESAEKAAEIIKPKSQEKPSKAPTSTASPDQPDQEEDDESTETTAEEDSTETEDSAETEESNETEDSTESPDEEEYIIVEESTDSDEEDNDPDTESNETTEADDVQDDSPQSVENTEIPRTKSLESDNSTIKIKAKPKSSETGSTESIKAENKSEIETSSTVKPTDLTKPKQSKHSRDDVKKPPPVSKSGGGPEGSNVFVEVEGKKIPLEKLDWRGVSSREGETADLSIDHKSDNLPLTGIDTAWVNFGIPWFINNKNKP